MKNKAISHVAKYGISYSATSRLSQDVLEHFFRAARSKEGLHDHAI